MKIITSAHTSWASAFLGTSSTYSYVLRLFVELSRIAWNRGRKLLNYKEGNSTL